ncbi:LysE family translocator [Priestia koreensis]|uniref:LysE family translocator n=1 Tax=Priestia koreensis TaxID=284581 RepID=UPI001F56A185|nr:LysE family transporter [Priestia koreensis]UNL86932.1 LysE family transporter [Priestia koreensis]
MDGWIMIVQYMVLGISLAAPVGPINLEMIKRGISGGFWSSWLVGLGGMTVDLLFMLFIFWGLTPYLQKEGVLLIVYGAGALMLLWVGFQSIKQSFSSTFGAQMDETRSHKSYLTGFLIAMTNPLNIIFWFGVYGSTLSETLQAHSLGTSLLYSGFILLGVLLWNLNVAFTVHFSRRLLHETILRLITFSAGAVLVYFGFKFLFQFISHL